ncbi:MAG: hypothetical protein H6727_03910 [Myxococcales bacterium]|nr:hypothetical protein [Myxococcales bacterium]
MAPRSPKHWRTDSSQHPGPPPHGIQPQRTPGWLRFSLKVLVLPFMVLDLLMQKLIQRVSPPPYQVEGACKKRGHCCHYILIGWHPMMQRWSWFGKFWLWWYTDVHGFYPRGFDVEGPGGDVAKVMSCRYLKEDGTCGQYTVRPAICRQWPRVEFTGRPHVLKGCGYRIVSTQDPSQQRPSQQQEPPHQDPPQETSHDQKPTTPKENAE